MLSTYQLTVQFGEKPLFENISVKFSDGYRYGLIGANGCGKSTFVKILGGDLDPSSGSVMLDHGRRLGKLRQNQFAYEDLRVLDVVMMGHKEMWDAQLERDAIYMNENASESDYLRASELESKFAEYGGYTAESRAGELLIGAGIPVSFHQQKMAAIPPGRKVRVLLAQALFSNPDVLLLDEPTNNLDIYTINWLEETLNRSNATMVIISHDRHFLNQVCTHIADMDYGTLKIYPGNYDDYMVAATAARERLLAANSRAKDKVADLQEFVRRFSANKSKARQATSRLKQIEKIKIDDIKPSSRQHPFIRFEVEKKLHNLAVVAEKINKSYGHNQVLKNVDLMIKSGEKIAIIGENGVGKTTLLRCLHNSELIDSGKVIWAEHANIGLMPQDTNEFFPDEKTLFEWLAERARVRVDDVVLRSILGRLLFSGSDVSKSTQVLSGGERGRLIWGALMLGGHNVLLLDEPTNHMDMESIEALQVALEKFSGTLIFVSHDREFVNALANRIVDIRLDGQIVDFHGNYDEYLGSDFNSMK